MDAACLATEVQIGQAVSARVEDTTFGQAVDRIGTERLATAEVLMIDLLLQRLAESKTDKEKDKAVLALWQALREDRRRPAGRPAAGGAQKQAVEKETAATAGASPADAADERAAEIARLIAAVEARLAAAEAGEGGPCA